MRDQFEPSHGFSELTGLPLNEETLRTLLANADECERVTALSYTRAEERRRAGARGVSTYFPLGLCEVVEIVGELKLAGLGDVLVQRYEERWYHANGTESFVTRNPMVWGQVRSAIARALIQCGDKRGLEYALDRMLEPQVEDPVINRVYAVETMRYAAKHLHADVSEELASVARLPGDERRVTRVAAFAELLIIADFYRQQGDLLADVYMARAREVLEKADPQDRPRLEEKLQQGVSYRFRGEGDSLSMKHTPGNKHTGTAHMTP